MVSKAVSQVSVSSSSQWLLAVSLLSGQSMGQSLGMQRPELTLPELPGFQCRLTQTAHLLHPCFFGVTHSHRCSLVPGTAWHSSFYLPPALPCSSQRLFLRNRNEELGSSAGRGYTRSKTLTQYSRDLQFPEFWSRAGCLLASVAKKDLVHLWYDNAIG